MDLEKRLKDFGLPVEKLVPVQGNVDKDAPYTVVNISESTVVLPQADVKIFLTASAEVRAERRLKELLERGEKNVTFDSILQDMKERDHRDMNRPVAPLKQAEDAVLLDTSDLSIEESIAAIKKIIEEKLQA